MKTFDALRGFATASILLFAAWQPNAFGDSVKGEWGPVQTKFDPALAAAMLAPGNSQVTGRASAKVGRFKKVYPSDVSPVMILPMTPFVEEWYLRFGQVPFLGIKHLPLEVFAFSNKSFTDKKGYFHFSNLKPGRYLLLGSFTHVVNASWKDQVGTEAGYNAHGGVVYSNPIYGPRQYDAMSAAKHVAKVVEIKTDGEIGALGDVYQ